MAVVALGATPSEAAVVSVGKAALAEPAAAVAVAAASPLLLLLLKISLKEVRVLLLLEPILVLMERRLKNLYCCIQSMAARYVSMR